MEFYGGNTRDVCIVPWTNLKQYSEYRKATLKKFNLFVLLEARNLQNEKLTLIILAD